MNDLHRTLRSLVCAVTTLVACCAATATVVHAQTAPDDAAGGIAVAEIDGRGHGHGVGMSQWGAYTLANDGAGAGDILATFYPGTEFGQAGGPVVVGVWNGGRDLAVRFPAGGELRSPRDGAQADGFPITFSPGAGATIVRSDRGFEVRPEGVASSTTPAPSPLDTAGTRQVDECVVDCTPDPDQPPSDDGSPEDPPSDGPDDECMVCTTTTTAPADDDPPVPAPGPDDPPGDDDSPPPTAPSYPTATQPIWAVPAGGASTDIVPRARSHAGQIEVLASGDGMRARNHVDIETYLKGMAEVPGTWPPAAVQAQAIAARTYALRAMRSAGELCDSEQCQVYGGIAKESGGQNAAVDATSGVVVTYRGSFASTFYSASGGGYSATVSEGFGTDYDLPYLVSKPYPESNPKPWQRRFSLADVAGRLDYPGSLDTIVVTDTGPSGRATAMELRGDAGVMPIGPQDFRRRLGLQSTLFTVATGTTNGPIDELGALFDDQSVDEVVAIPLVGESIDTFDAASLVPTADTIRQTAIEAPVVAATSPNLPAAPVAFAVVSILGVGAAGVNVRRRLAAAEGADWDALRRMGPD